MPYIHEGAIRAHGAWERASDVGRVNIQVRQRRICAWDRATDVRGIVQVHESEHSERVWNGSTEQRHFARLHG